RSEEEVNWTGPAGGQPIPITSHVHPSTYSPRATTRHRPIDAGAVVAYPHPRDTSPQREAPIWKDGSHDDDRSRGAARNAAFLLRPLRQAPRLGPPKPEGCAARPLASRQGRKIAAEARHRS